MKLFLNIFIENMRKTMYSNFSLLVKSAIMEHIRNKYVSNMRGQIMMGEWYFEYEIQVNRPGLLGDIASLLGMLRVNIVSINGVDEERRGMLLSTDNEESIQRFISIVSTMENINVTRFREPKLRDRLAVRHGHYIPKDADEKNTFRFVRDELGILVDFMAELFKKEGNKLIGIRGMPRVGKTESIVAASVCANKRWIFLSSTMIKQTVRNSLMGDEFNSNNIFILDGAVTRQSNDERHQQLVREMMGMPTIKVIEHPDLFVQHSPYKIEDFDYIIELRHDPDEQITYEIIEKNNRLSNSDNYGGYGGFGGFDF